MLVLVLLYLPGPGARGLPVQPYATGYWRCREAGGRSGQLHRARSFEPDPDYFLGVPVDFVLARLDQRYQCWRPVLELSGRSMCCALLEPEHVGVDVQHHGVWERIGAAHVHPQVHGARRVVERVDGSGGAGVLEFGVGQVPKLICGLIAVGLYPVVRSDPDRAPPHRVGVRRPVQDCRFLVVVDVHFDGRWRPGEIGGRKFMAKRHGLVGEVHILQRFDGHGLALVPVRGVEHETRRAHGNAGVFHPGDGERDRFGRSGDEPDAVFRLLAFGEFDDLGVDRADTRFVVVDDRDDHRLCADLVALA